MTARNLDEGEAAYFDVLTDLVEAYESEVMPEEDVPPGSVLKEMLYQNGLSQHDLAKQTGIAQSTLSAICQGTRKPTVDQAKKLGERFKLKPAAFLELKTD
ncbi:MAG: hypothetical protein BGO49_18240 [Planctomycetales bacterium 71-10]|nr:MAG: hypothetical protein BGO49_18240 [Planctomycetales bacterium 71-10]